MDNKKDENNKIELSAQQENEFTRGFKIGVLKGLHKKGMLTDKQLNRLLELQK